MGLETLNGRLIFPQTWAAEVEKRWPVLPFLRLAWITVSPWKNALFAQTVVFLWRPPLNDLQYRVMRCILWNDGINKWCINKSLKKDPVFMRLHDFTFSLLQFGLSVCFLSAVVEMMINVMKLLNRDKHVATGHVIWYQHSSCIFQQHNRSLFAVFLDLFKCDYF